MGGGLMQLVAYGAQDVYLTVTRSLLEVTHRRHTNFAMVIEQTFNGQAISVAVFIACFRNGDFEQNIFTSILPEINQADEPAGTNVYARWLDCPGEQMIPWLKLKSVANDRQHGDRCIWNQLTQTSDKKMVMPK